MEAQIIYLKILRDTLYKKRKVLEQIFAVTKKQEQLFFKTEPQIEEMDSCMDEKSEYLKVLQQLDDGFEKMYEKVKRELQASPEKFSEEIRELQTVISQVMDLSIAIQALERKNKSSMERYLLRHRKNIQTYRTGRQKVNTYYNTMTGFQPQQSYFMDKKK